MFGALVAESASAVVVIAAGMLLMAALAGGALPSEPSGAALVELNTQEQGEGEGAIFESSAASLGVLEQSAKRRYSLALDASDEGE